MSFSINLAGLDSWKAFAVREATKLRGNFSGERAKDKDGSMRIFVSIV